MCSRMLDDFRAEGPVWSGKLSRGGTFADGRPAAGIAGRVECAAPSSDWRGFGTLRFELLNAGQRPVVGGIEIYDRAAIDSPELAYGDYIDRRYSLLIPEGVTHVIVRIDPIRTTQGTRTLDLEHVEKLAILVPDEPCFSIANLRLSEDGDEPDAASAAQPGESVFVMTHLDVRCFTWRPDDYREPEDIDALRDALGAERMRLATAIRSAEINGKAAQYAHAALVTADIALGSRPLLAWHFLPRAKRRNYQAALEIARRERTTIEALLSSRRHEDDEDDSNLPISYVRDVPRIADLSIAGDRLVDRSGRPVLLCAMGYHNEGELLRFFAPENHKLEIYAVGGGSRYDIEWSPVYEAFHRHAPATHRVGWRGWCGHLIKDQWAMGGRKENVVLCLENRHILEAIDEYNRLHADEWLHRDDLLYVILGYELTYLCYCDESLARFRDWLRERHGTIGALNERWGADHRDFAEAAPPPTEGHGPTRDANRAAWFDWVDWNSRRFTDHLRWSKESVRKLHASIPICTGGSHSMTSPNNGTTGIDEELIINEVDDVILHEGNDLLQIDLFRALSDRPRPMVDPEQGGDCSGWLLNYLHGKSAICMFWWPKQPSRQFPRSTLQAPVQGTMPPSRIYEHLRQALDVRRLAAELVAFWDVPRQVALVYSRTSILQVDPLLMTASTTPYLSSLRSTYEAARCLDAPVSFVSERQLLAGRAGGYRLLILPAVRHVPPAVFEAIDAYVCAGGSVVVIAESLVADEYNRPADYLGRWGLTVRSVERPEVAGFGEYSQGYDQNLARRVTFGSSAARRATRFDGWPRSDIRTSGVFQHVTGGTTLATDDSGAPLLVRIDRGAGRIWYLPGSVEIASCAELLDHMYDESGVTRPLCVRPSGATRKIGLEARLSRRRDDDLVYVANNTGAAVEVAIGTDRPIHEIRELRTLRYCDEPTARVEDGEVLLFSLREDPAERVRLAGGRTAGAAT